MRYCIVKDTRNNKYKQKARRGTEWTENKSKAQLFRTKGAATISCYGYSINPDRRKIGAKIILPDWIEIQPIEVLL